MEIIGKKRKRKSTRRRKHVAGIVAGRKHTRRRRISGAKMTDDIMSDVALVGGALLGVIASNVVSQKMPKVTPVIREAGKTAIGFIAKRYIKNHTASHIASGFMVQSAIELTKPIASKMTGVITGEEPEEYINVVLGESEDLDVIEGEELDVIEGEELDVIEGEETEEGEII